MNGLKTSFKVGLQMMEALSATGDRPLTVRLMAEQLNQSEKYLEQLLLPMRRARLVRSLRGPHGGYVLGRPASYITLLEVVELLQGAVVFCDCPTGQCGECVSPTVFQALEDCLEGTLASLTLQDLIAAKAPILPRHLALSPVWVQGGLGI